MPLGVDVEYKVSVSARLPAASAAPTITEVDELTPVGSISYADELNGDGEASLSVNPDTLNSDVAVRLKNLKELPCELNIYRESMLIWRGPILSCQVQGPTLTINARGLLYYLRYMTLESDLLYTSATDQFTIGKGLVDTYQALQYGNYGIDTSGIGTSGVTRIRRYFYKENQNVYKRLGELAEVGNGFDYWVDAASRDLMFDSERGTDLSDEVYADETNILNPNIFWSVSADDIASEAIAVGQDAKGTQQSIVGTDSNTTLRQQWGRATIFGTGEDVTTQATINNHAERLLDSRSEQFFQPGPSIFPVTDGEPDDFSPGDTISYLINIGALGQFSLLRRVRAKRVTAEDDGTEDMDLELI
jgi:hypothetical protein